MDYSVIQAFSDPCASLLLGLQVHDTVPVFLCGLWGSEFMSSCLHSEHNAD